MIGKCGRTYSECDEINAIKTIGEKYTENVLLTVNTGQ
jgi:hypothetical protein